MLNTSNSYHAARTGFTEVFDQFGDNAERLYREYDIFALKFLEEFGIEGLTLLEKYGKKMTTLYPFLDYRDIFLLYNNPGNNLNKLEIFSPKALADFYKTFGKEGVQHLAGNPENFFFITENTNRGIKLLNLAREKGEIIFPIARKHGIEFAELYDNDVLNIIIKFQDEGLLGIKEYGEKAKTLFRLFINDDTFYQVMKTYGHKQTIPIIYLFYDNKDFNSQIYHYLTTTNTYKWFSGWWYGVDTNRENTQDDITVRQENARRAINLILELGNDFIDRFEILDIQNVREEAITIITNKLRNFFVSEIIRINRKRIQQEDITFQDKLFAGLDILGLIPLGSGISKMTKPATKVMRNTLPAKGLKGLICQTDNLFKMHGDDVVRFVAKHGDEGMKILKETDGKILTIVQHYGDDAVRYVTKYGTNTIPVIEKYGTEVITLARRYGDEVIKYTMLYGDDGLRVIQKHGKDIVLLSTVYGDDVMKLSILYGKEILPYVSRYGANGVKVMGKYGNDVIPLARKYGDDVIKYVGMYGTDGLALARKGKAGLLVMRFMPPKVFVKCIKFIKYGMLVFIFFSFITHPLAFLSGLIKALSWLFGIHPVIIATILGFIITFLLFKFLRKFSNIFKPLLLFLCITKGFITGQQKCHDTKTNK